MADKTRIRGITIELNGDASGLNKELKSVNSELKSTQADLRDVNKLLKLDPGNTELLQQKQKLLNQALEETKQKLDVEKRALAEVAAHNTTGEQQRQQDALQREVIETEEKVKSLEKQITQFGSVGVQQVAALGEKFKEIGDKITSVGQTMTMKFTVPIVAAFGLASNAASDYEENLNKIEVAFGDNAEAVTAWANNAIDEFGLSKVAATEAASSFGALAKGVGLSDDAAAQMSISLAGLSADLGSYFNQANDVSAKALEGIFTGEAEALKKFGVVMNQTNLEAFAKSIGKVYSEMSDVEKVTLRYQFVLAKTGDAQGDYARTSDGTANSVKTFKAALEDLAVAFGQQLLPIITPVIQGLTNVIKAVGNLPAPVQKVIVVLGLLLAAIGPILVAVGSFMSGIGGLMTALPGLSAALGTMGLAGAATTGTTALAGMGAGMTALLPVVAGLAAVMAGVLIGKTIYDNWDLITEAASKAKDALSDAAESIKSNFSDMNDTIIEKLDSAAEAVSSKASAIASTLSSMWESVKSTVSNIAQQLSSVQSSSGYTGYGYNSSYRSSSVRWHADAMSEGIIMNSPTIFGMHNGRLQGAGEAGAEALIGVNSLREMVREAAASAASNVSINVYAQPGQDVKALAKAVEQEFVLWQRQRKVAMV